jgi:hypothetical protein
MYGVMHERPEETPFHKFFYGVIMRVLMAILLLGISSFIDRPRYGGFVFDFIIRIGIYYWFFILYRNIANISTFSMMKEYRWSKEDIRPSKKIQNIAYALFFDIMSGIFTWFILRTFLSCGMTVSVLGGLANAFIIGIPVTTRYWIWKT